MQDTNGSTTNFFSKLKSHILDHWHAMRAYFAAKTAALKAFFGQIDMGINKNVFWAAFLMCSLMAMILLLFDTYYYANSFKVATKKILESSCHISKMRIKEYTMAFVRSTKLSVSMVKDNVISPSTDYEQFYGYLLQQLKNKPEFINIFLTNPEGDLFLLTRIKDKNKATTYAMIKALKKADATEITEIVLDADGQKISTTTHVAPQPDPRLRPWYLKAVKDKKITWSDPYIFHPYSNYIMPIPGITVSSPIYAADGQLLGVFGIDMQFENLSYAMKDIGLTQGAAILILADDGLFKKKIYPYQPNLPMTLTASANDKLIFSDINFAFSNNSFALYRQNLRNDFFYNYNIAGVSYAIFYCKLDDVINNSWYAATVVPMDSMNWHLERNKLMLLFYAGITLGTLLFLFFIFSNQFAKAIKQIVNYTNGIKNMDFSQQLTIVSHIKEIKLLGKTMVLMADIIKSFSRYVPAELIRKIIKSGVASHIEGESYEMSILFIDICNFSNIVENMKPQDVMEYLSRYFDQMTKVVYGKSGVLDKYIGDAIMCFWGAPYIDDKHALHACQCAVLFFEALEEINKQFKLQRLPQISVRVSVATGPAVMGNVGSSDRLSYTVLGNTVNIASRLEALNKVYGTEILISENTYNQVQGQLLCRLVDRVAVRGLTNGIYIYEIFRRANMYAVSTEELLDYNKDFANAFKFYEVGDWEKAIALFEELTKKYSNDKLSVLYLDRCKILFKNPPVDWNGIWKF